ncbi:mycofactocin biosynthesis chaperone MftB [Gandjariella thermophila]|uniref:Mycofactocin system protein MftB n=1 Tax=Gandjariella thermophila TaxID=1931992 RepID=A0A4D4JBC0_9PSEU|nr:mycofactocin biosynthesis chaperone MftB [Gandjariella thermophila]GDY31679.1 mycofactocin system protein MftB [Gandjariella thermophila]
MPAEPTPFDPAARYRLSPSVALRPEPFGALAYHFGNRRLSFLKAPELVRLVRDLDRHACVHDALAGLPESRRAAYLRALASLAASDMIVPA